MCGFPLALTEWHAHYDAAGVPVQWDTEQLDGSCKNWVTAGRWVSVHNADAGVTLATPDAPLVQIGRPWLRPASRLCAGESPAAVELAGE